MRPSLSLRQPSRRARQILHSVEYAPLPDTVFFTLRIGFRIEGCCVSQTISAGAENDDRHDV